MGFIKSHKKLTIALGIILLLVVVMFAIRYKNTGHILSAPSDAEVADGEEGNEASDATALEDDLTSDTPQSKSEETKDKKEDTTYDISMGLAGGSKDDGRVKIEPKDTEKKEKKKVEYQTEPTYNPVVRIFDNTVVPRRNVDGSSCKDYLKSVSLENFGTYWGSDLTEEDFKGNDLVLVGVEQDANDYIKGEDLQSTGWLINNLSKLKDTDAVKFVNLHTIGSLSDTHVALLCSYDWYSVYGLKDTLVLFEDISGTLKVSDFKDGDIFSALVYVHNIKVSNVNGFNVIVLEYNTFSDGMKIKK